MKSSKKAVTVTDKTKLVDKRKCYYFFQQKVRPTPVRKRKSEEEQLKANKFLLKEKLGIVVKGDSSSNETPSQKLSSVKDVANILSDDVVLKQEKKLSNAQSTDAISIQQSTIVTQDNIRASPIQQGAQTTGPASLYSGKTNTAGSDSHITNQNVSDLHINSGWDLQRLLFLEYRGNSLVLLKELELFLHKKKRKPLNLPKFVEYQFLIPWKELVSEAQIVFRDWQTQTAKDIARIKEEKESLKASEVEQRAKDSDTSSSTAHRGQHRSGTAMSEYKMNRSAKQKRLVGESESSEKEEGKDRQYDTWKGVKIRGSPASVYNESVYSKVSISSVKRKTTFSSPMKTAGAILEQLSELSLSHSDGRKDQNQFTLNFVLSSKESIEKGWIQGSDISLKTFLEWARMRMQSAIRQKDEADRHEQENGYLCTPQVLLMGENRIRTKSARPKTSSIKPDIDRVAPKFHTPAWMQAQAPDIWQAISNDGTVSAYYPENHLALIFSHAGVAKSGFFINAFDVPNVESSTQTHSSHKARIKLIASFTNKGCGAVMYTTGKPRFISTKTYCELLDEHGGLVKHFKWPPSTSKLPATIEIRINQYLTFKCASKTDMNLILEVSGAQTVFNIGQDFDPDKNIITEKDTYIVSGLSFSSLSAKDLQKPSKVKGKKVRTKKEEQTKDKIKKSLTEYRPHSDKSIKSVDVALNEDLHTIQNKILSIFDSWFKYYRQCLNIVVDTKSAKNSLRFRDVKSALPAAVHTKLELRKGYTARPLTAAVLQSSNSIADPHEPDTSRIMKRLGIRSFEMFNEDFLTCPVLLRCLLLGVDLPTTGAGTPVCHCNRSKLPLISDLELTFFLKHLQNKNQIIVIGIVDSESSATNSCQNLLEGIYDKSIVGRSHPCLQSQQDEYRVLGYDLTTAALHTKNTLPLLQRKHNVQPGMCLMYCKNRLLFADFLFNGYSREQRDFNKQIRWCQRKANENYSLPPDFRFR